MKRYLIPTYIALQFADVGSTLQFLHTGHGVEANPVVAYMMAHIGLGWIVVKLVVALGLVPLFVYGRTRYIAAMVAMYAFTVVNNLAL